MRRTETKRRLFMLAAGSVLLLATACGGGDKGPTGPDGGATADFHLVALGFAGLPADAEVEDCTLTRFFGGGLQVRENGTWQITLQVHDGNYGDWGYHDEGEIEQDGPTLWFDSQISGTSHQGTVDGSEIRIMYDWCENGVADVQLVFDQ